MIAPSMGFDAKFDRDKSKLRGLIWLPQHRISERALAIARLVVVPVIYFQSSLQFQMAAIGRGPLPQKVGAVAIENEMVDASRVLGGNVDRSQGRLE